ncbi:MAG: ATP-binding protein [Rhodobacter sp.]|nr:ATP-binding protein [Rhodobacter sp.]MCY4240127.1 ATP-binding protein [Rhodobacter sp.]
MDTVTLMDAAPAPMVLIGPDERIAAANGAAEEVFGPVIRGYHYITALRQPALLDCIDEAFAAQEPRTIRLPIRDSTWDIIFNATAAPIVDRGGLLLFLEDVSHVEEASQMRRDFVANVSHELRSPLTAIMGFIETLRGPARDDPEAQDRFLGIMECEAKRMNRLIRDLLSLSRVEAEERRMPTGHVDVSSLASSVVENFEAQAKAKGVALGLSGTETPVYVRGSADQLMQVFTNLMENALKYGGDRTNVEVTTRSSDPELHCSAVHVTVRDNGDGIDPRHISRLTERFYRIDTHRSRETAGTGLGLAIVKHILNRHRGRLSIRSELRSGSSFAAVLPLSEE